MKSNNNAQKAANVLGNPVILKGAWMRVQSWYKYGEMPPEPELSQWQLYPEAMLRKLAIELRENRWKPEKWQQVPYPKKGARLRHYMMPTVRDQVAFMAHMVVLGPILDHQVKNFAFGNRWYRPIAWDCRQQPPKWKLRPYPVLTDKIYLSYARSHGLFRRVAHWTVAQMTKAELPSEYETGQIQHPNDYNPKMLPDWIREKWWECSLDSPSAYWASLDVELAYPSVRLPQLAESMKSALQQQVKVEPLYDSCPGQVLDAISMEEVRVEIGKRMMDALENITLETSGIPQDTWSKPKNHRLPDINENSYDGIPTGLAISGVLFNVMLLKVDQEIHDYLSSTSEKLRGAIVRFADDMYVLSRSPEGLLALIEAVHRALSLNSNATSLAVPNDVSNICINLRKIAPGPVRKVIYKYLIAQGYKKCKKCKQPLPPESQKISTMGVKEWWDEINHDYDFSQSQNALKSIAIKQGDVGPFVTSLVERLSDMGTDTLRQRFGEGARDHLARLHELARFEIEDEQVRPDTRRAFSVNRLVRAWLPTARSDGEQQRELRKIRDTIGFVLERTPWKFSIWRAVVRGSARCPLEDLKNGDGVNQGANEWLFNQLRRISCSNDPLLSEAWINNWPKFDEADKHADERSDNWRPLYLSYIRTAFWRALAQLIRELERHAAGTKSLEENPWAPSPNFWTTRAVGEGMHESVANSLSQIDKWVEVLYSAYDTADFHLWQWELDAFVEAVLAVHSTVDLANAWRTTKSPGQNLQVPTTAKLETMTKTKSILLKFGRLQQTGPRRNRKLNFTALANVKLGHWSDDLGVVLFPDPNKPRILRADREVSNVLASGLSLGCFGWIGLDFARQAIPSMHLDSEMIKQDVYLLYDYDRARRLCNSQQINSVATLPTLHRLIWGSSSKGELSSWPMSVWDIPTLGLPSRVAATLFVAVGRTSLPKKWSPEKGPLTWEIKKGDKSLAAGRHWQFVQHEELMLPNENKQKVCIKRSTAWEVAPHAAFYLPFLSAPAHEIDKYSYALYCDALLLLTALAGGEFILDDLVRWGVRGTPFMDRWAWRSRIHLPQLAWKWIEQILRWKDTPRTNRIIYRILLNWSLKDWSCEKISCQDFLPERIDVSLSLSEDLEIVRTISLAGDLRGPSKLPNELRVTNAGIHDELFVRVGQVNAWSDNADVVDKFPMIPTATAHTIIEQVTNAFLAPTQSADKFVPQLVIFPELAIPQQEIRSLRDLVRKEEKGAVAGLYWRELKPPFHPPKYYKRKHAYFVNEAELILPVGDGRGPPGIRWFRIRKPVPAHMEDGLAKALSSASKKKGNVPEWHIVRGQKWYRFVHPKWGDFTVAICADLIDTAPWRALRGELLHLLMVAFNKDVDLFDSLTWVRAYENYVNVVSVNHGCYGGSFLWTPRRTFGRELARLRGGNLVLTADVKLPVKQLFDEQNKGVKKAVKQATKKWKGKNPPDRKFKAPPPGFIRKWL